MLYHVQPLSPHLLCYARFQQTEEVTETVKTQPVLSAPNSQLRKQDDQDRRLFTVGTQPDSPPSEIWLCYSTVTSISSLF